ncbi:hypothetical protein VKT23_008245 [Stygiomarasmius scandens]|uniref:Uncharacterized protein n=1 Tax=Marasmiellus scandens TaxID=2682957 RepID=A0ABR1JK62_9AGAR
MGGFRIYSYPNGVARARGAAHSDDDMLMAIDVAQYGSIGKQSDFRGMKIQIFDTEGNELVVLSTKLSLAMLSSTPNEPRLRQRILFPSMLAWCCQELPAYFWSIPADYDANVFDNRGADDSLCCPISHSLNYSPSELATPLPGSRASTSLLPPTLASSSYIISPAKARRVGLRRGTI